MGVELGGASRFDVVLVGLDPTIGSEIRKTRPCLVISPDEMNRSVRTVIVAPLTSTSKRYPTRISCSFDNKQGYVVLDQLRTVDVARLIRKLGHLDDQTCKQVLAVLSEMFAP